MDNTTMIRIELQTQATNLINQYMLNNDQIVKEYEAGIQKAFENFDIEAAIEHQIKLAISQAVQHPFTLTRLRGVIQDKVDAMAEKMTKAFEEARDEQ